MPSPLPRRLVTAVVAALVTGGLAVIAPAAAAPGPAVVPVPAGQRAVPGGYLVELPLGTRGADVRALATRLTAAYGGTARLVYDAGYKGFALSATPAQAHRLARDPAVVSVHEDAYVTFSGTQLNPPSWGLDRIDGVMDNAYQYPNDAHTVRAYVLDTGIRLGHQEFAIGRAVCGFDVSGTGCSPCSAHATHVASVIGGVSAGAAKQVRIVSVKVVPCGSSATVSGVIAGVNYVTQSQQAAPSVRSVADISLTGPPHAQLNAAVQASIAANVHYSIAAGNSNASACDFSPGSVADATTVGATATNDTKASFSNHGPCVDLYAPGMSIYGASHTANNAYALMSGTSQAAGFATGAAAMLRHQDPSLTAVQVATVLNGHADPLPFGRFLDVGDI